MSQFTLMNLCLIREKVEKMRRKRTRRREKRDSMGVKMLDEITFDVSQNTKTKENV